MASSSIWHVLVVVEQRLAEETSMHADVAGCLEPSLEEADHKGCIRAIRQSGPSVGSALPLGLQSGGLQP